MRKILVAACLLGATLPALAQAMTEQEMIALALQSGVCGDAGVVGARLDEAGRIVASCGTANTNQDGSDAGWDTLLAEEQLGFVFAGTLAAAAVAGGGGGSTPDTQ